MANYLELKNFSDVSLDDKFFDSLKSDYKEFSDWFKKKSSEKAYVMSDDATGKICGFLYLKIEDGPVLDVTPNLGDARRLKVGTLKIVAHGTKLGERVVKKLFDKAVAEAVDEIYVTVFSSHGALIKLFERYGFLDVGEKKTTNGTERVLVRSMKKMSGDIVKDYPVVHTGGVSKFLLAIYPEFHTKLLPDSILHTEKPHIVEDISHANTIHKLYIAKIALTRMKRGDVVVMYRTGDGKAAAFYRSVATSVCVVEQILKKKDFPTLQSFIDFARPHSVFSDEELTEMYTSWPRLYAALMTYNAAFQKRPIRGELLHDVGISEHPRWDMRRLTDEQFFKIMELGKVDESLIVN